MPIKKASPKNPYTYALETDRSGISTERLNAANLFNPEKAGQLIS